MGTKVAFSNSSNDNRHIDWKKSCILLDVDGCITPINNHDISIGKISILHDLYEYLDGAITFVTDNDMRIISPIAPFMPIVSEHGTRFRLTNDIAIENAISLSPELDIETMARFAADLAEKEDIAYAMSHGGDHPHVVIERKQSGIGLNYDISEEHKQHAIFLATQILEKFNLTDSFHVSTSGADCIEIIANGFGKYTALDKIMEHENFKGRIPIMFGNAMSDQKMMRSAYKNYNGCGVSVSTIIPDGPEIHTRLKDHNETWKMLRSIRDELKLSKEVKLSQDHAQVSPAPTAR